MIEDNSANKEAVYNQAQLQTMRIHEILLRVDRMNTEPLARHDSFNLYNYEVIFNDLSSLISTICTKINTEETESIMTLRDLISQTILHKSVFQNKLIPSLTGNKIEIRKNNQNWNDIRELLFMFRNELEILMDKHGYGMPSKSDPKKAIEE